MPRRGIAARRVRMQQTVGGVGVPIRPGGRRRRAASAAGSRVVGIGSGSASGERAEQAAAEEAAQAECEGQRPADASEKSPCARPGCYELFVPSQHCPHQRFCSRFVPSGFTASSSTRGAVGTAAERPSAESPPDSAVAQESTSPHMVGPCHVGLLLFHCCCMLRGNSSRRMVSGLRETGKER